jgi:hypothetical protein
MVKRYLRDADFGSKINEAGISKRIIMGSRRDGHGKIWKWLDQRAKGVHVVV